MKRACIIILSDREYTGEEEDNKGKELVKYLENNKFEILVYKIIPEIEEIYKEFLMKCCDNYCVEFVVTVGNKKLSEVVANDIKDNFMENDKVYIRKKTFIKNLKDNFNDTEIKELMSFIQRM